MILHFEYIYVNVVIKFKITKNCTERLRLLYETTMIISHNIDVIFILVFSKFEHTFYKRNCALILFRFLFFINKYL